MKKAFDQTVRDLKREVNKKVLKVPGVEQKILDATSNEPWGPHGSHLADIAQATRNYHEYQMIMHVIWKRLNDTGKNWRHVYKALTVLEYLAGHGSERVIDEIKEHAYQISTLSEFQYIDSSGRDQGSNVRRKSQALVSLVNDKERIQEIRQKALANRDKYRSTYASGGRQSPYSGSGDYGDRRDDDRYEGRYRDEDRNGYGRERDWGNKDDDRYGRGGDSYHRDGDRYSRDSDERYGKDTYNDDYRGGRSSDDYNFGARKSLDRDRDRSFEDDDRHSSRSGGARVDDPSQDDRRLEHKHSGQSVGAPPSYEETMRDAHDRVQDERAGGNAAAPAAKASSPPLPKAVSPESTSQGPNYSAADASASVSNTENDGFDEFDPRGFAPAAPPATNGLGPDLFGDSSATDLFNSLALVPVTSTTASFEADVTTNSDFGTNFVALSSASAAFSQPSEDPFGDAPFKATNQENLQSQQQSFAPATAFQSSSLHGQGAAPPPPPAPKVEAPPSFDFGDSLGGLTFTPTVANDQQHFVASPPPMATEFTMAQANSGVHGGFLPTVSSGLAPPQVSQQLTGLTNIPAANMNYPPQSGANMNYPPQSGVSMNYLPSGANMNYPPQSGANMNYPPQSGAAATLAPQPAVHSLNPQTAPINHPTQPGLSSQLAPQSAFAVPARPTQPAKDKFETKSTVWSDTLNRGLVNLNISGAKVNPLADIGVDFDSINRMEKRKEKSSAAPVTSTITMGKAMGSGSGIGRAGAGAGGLAPSSSPMVGSGMGMGMGMGMGIGGSNGMGRGMGMGMGMGMGAAGGAGMGMGNGMGMANYGMNQQMGMGVNRGMGMGMNQGAQMRPQNPGQGMPGFGYNPMGMGGYGTQQPYGGGYR